MTPQTAIDYMENEIRCIQRAKYCDRDCAKCNLVKEDEPLIEAFGVAIKALEKQIPKKVERQAITDKIALRFCPTCKVRFLRYGHKFCGECGQALDWSDEV